MAVTQHRSHPRQLTRSMGWVAWLVSVLQMASARLVLRALLSRSSWWPWHSTKVMAAMDRESMVMESVVMMALALESQTNEMAAMEVTRNNS